MNLCGYVCFELELLGIGPNFGHYLVRLGMGLILRGDSHSKPYFDYVLLIRILALSMLIFFDHELRYSIV